MSRREITLATWRIWFFVFAGILAISSASVLIRFTEAPPLSIATYRMVISSLLLLVPGIVSLKKSHEIISRKMIFFMVLSGICLAAHFGFWITSLSYTTVASSVSLVNTAPIFVALAGRKLLKENPGRLFWVALVLTTIGSVALTGVDFSSSAKQAVGDVLAILGAVALSGYLIIGRYALRKLSFVAYIFVVYGAGALWLLLVSFCSGVQLTGFPPSTILMFFLIAFVPQFIGHSIFNWSLKFLPASVVSLLILGEPIGASLLAYFLFKEIIHLKQAVSLVIIGTGILLGSLSMTMSQSIDREEQTN